MRILHILFIAVFAIVLLLQACGVNTPGRKTEPIQGENPETPQVYELSGQAFIVLSSDSLKSNGSAVSGKGSFVFKTPRPEADSNYDLLFGLEDGKQLSLTTNANDKIGQGVSLIFSRIDGSLQVRLVAGNENFDLSADYKTIDASKPISLNVDLHAHGHVVVQFENKRFDYTFSTQVPGRFWGFSIDGASLTKAVAGPAKVEG